MARLPIVLSCLVGLVACHPEQPTVAPSAVQPTVAPSVERPEAPSVDEGVAVTDNPPSAAEPEQPDEPEPADQADPEDARVELARQVLADQLGVAGAEFTVVEFTVGRWSNGSAGCPKPGRKYPLKIVEGYRVVLEHGGVQYHLHGVKSRSPRVCTTPNPRGLLVDS